MKFIRTLEIREKITNFRRFIKNRLQCRKLPPTMDKPMISLFEIHVLDPTRKICFCFKIEATTKTNLVYNI